MVPAELCMRCGACCASYRVSFYWAEADPEAGGGVPPALVEPLPPHLVCMKGTRNLPCRCVALRGEVGAEVFCTIYAGRPSPCREFGGALDRCDAARALHGLPPLDRALLAAISPRSPDPDDAGA